ncbi:MAG: sulfatase [Verrucomicrobiota bacterium]
MTNILLITTDQQRWDHLGLAGLAGIETPNLDRLGREGRLFNRAYCPSPTCTPSRVSTLTGRYPSRHGSWSIGVNPELMQEKDSVAWRLRESGYRTAMIGKAHFHNQNIEESLVLGESERTKRPELKPTTDIPTDAWRKQHSFLGFDHLRLSMGHNIQQVPKMHYLAWLEDQGATPGQIGEWFPFYAGKSFDAGKSMGVWDIPEQLHPTRWIGGETEAFIESAGAGDAPWFCWSSLQDPHVPFVCPQPWFDKVEAAAMRLFETAREGEFDDKPAFYKRVWEARHGDWFGEEGWGPLYDSERRLPPACAFPNPYFEERAALAMQATLGMIAFIDDAVGKLLDKLDATRQMENTLVVFTSDHGEYHGHHGFWGKGLPAYEDAQRIPFLARGAGVRPGSKSEALVSLVDLMPTFLEAAGAPVPPGVQGISLLPLFSGERESVRDAVLIEARAKADALPQRTLVTDRHKLIVYGGTDEGELYDLQQDPDQYENLWDRPEHTALQIELLKLYARVSVENEGTVPPRTSFA